MAVSKKVKGKTPSGGDYSEIFYYDDNGNEVDEEDATNCRIRECKKDGTVINEIYGEWEPKKKK